MSAHRLRFAACSISMLLTLACLAWHASLAPAQGTPAQRARSSAEQITFYVSTVGNDTWSGRLDEPNADGTDGPLASLQKAQNIVREIKAATGGLTKPVTVMLRGGVYPQTEPIVFTAADSGTKECPVTLPGVSGREACCQRWQRDPRLASR